METFFTFLEKRVSDCSSPLCIALDPEHSPAPLENARQACEFCLHLAQQTARYAAAFKVATGFFSARGAEGIAALQQLATGIQTLATRYGSMMPLILELPVAMTILNADMLGIAANAA